MANLMQLINKSKTIEEKAKATAADVVSQFKHGQIKTQQEMLYKTFNAMKKFYGSIGKPTMVTRYAHGAPSSIDYNATMKEIYNDINIIMEESENLANVLGEAYSQVEIDRQLLDNQIRLIEQKLGNVKFKLENNETKNVFIDSFINMNYVDSGFCKLPPATVNTNFGYISLTTTESNNINTNAAIEILPDSNGFPGNTHQVNIINNEPKFIGEEGLHLSIADILDNNSDTWFEYELYKIPPQTLVETLNLGYKYEEGRQWITDGNKLTLGLKISFNKSELINNISMSPFIPPDKDAVAPIIRSILISDGKGTVRELINVIDIFNGDKVYTFPKQYCKTLTVIFEQELPYSTTIGHIYFKELSNQNLDYFKLSEMKFNKRTDGPKPRIENVQITYNDESQQYIQPAMKYGDIVDNEEMIKNNLFQLPESDENIKSYIETLIANRFHIGIRDITLSNYSYQPESEYVSKNFTTDDPINAVSLTAVDFVPEEFEKITDLDGNRIDWIQYYFSIDEGVQWHPIIPVGSYKNEGFTHYLINAGTPSELRRDDVGYIDMDDDVYDIRVKIEIKRPTDIPDSEYYSPIIFEYKLQVD